MANWGLIGAATALAPQQTLDEIVAGRIAEQERQRKAEEAAIEMAAKKLKMSLDTDANRRENVSNERGGEYLKIAQGQEGRAAQKFGMETADRERDKAFEAGLDAPTLRRVNLTRLGLNEPEQRPMVVGKNLVDPSGKVLFSAPEDTPATQQRRTQWIEVSGEGGKRVKRLVDMNTGDVIREEASPDRPVSAKESEQYGLAKTIEDKIDEIIRLGDETKWAGVGPLGIGTLKGYAKQFGFGDDRGAQLRAKIANLRGIVAKERGGSAFTPTEWQMLDAYMADQNQGGDVNRIKLKEFKDFLVKKRQAQFGPDALRPIPSHGGAPSQKLSAEELIRKYGG